MSEPFKAVKTSDLAFAMSTFHDLPIYRTRTGLVVVGKERHDIEIPLAPRPKRKNRSYKIPGKLKELEIPDYVEFRRYFRGETKEFVQTVMNRRTFQFLWNGYSIGFMAIEWAMRRRNTSILGRAEQRPLQFADLQDAAEGLREEISKRAKR